jgi:hypothetical protein
VIRVVGRRDGCIHDVQRAQWIAGLRGGVRDPVLHVERVRRRQRIHVDGEERIARLVPLLAQGDLFTFEHLESACARAPVAPSPVQIRRTSASATNTRCPRAMRADRRVHRDALISRCRRRAAPGEARSILRR